MNQINVTGPKIAPIPAVPCRCTANSAEMMTTRDRHHPLLQRRRGNAEAFHRAEHRDGRGDDAVAVQQGGAEEAVPTSQRYSAVAAPSPWGRTSASEARIPPSPWLSARMTTVRYLNVTTKLSDQKISESTPSTLPLVTGTPWGPMKHSLSA